MRVALRSWMVCVLGLVSIGFSCATCALAAQPPRGEASSDVYLFSGSLVVQGLQLFDGGEQERDASEARRESPVAVMARAESQSKYASLDGTGAAKLAHEVFPAVIDDAAGGPPSLPAGETIVGFPAVNVAQVNRGGGKYGVVESSAPMAVEPSPGHRVPVNLALTEVGSAFEPKTALARVRVPKQLGDGVALSGSGVSLTPVDAQGSPLAGSEGSVDGATVFYANTQTDADTIVKPTTFGFNIDTQLRSSESPQQLRYEVGLPQGASLVQDVEGSGAVRVVDVGETLAVIAPPVAHDAEGTPVPVSMSVSGDLLTVAVAPLGAYRLPVEVDPAVEDPMWQNEWYYGTYYRTQWHFEYFGTAFAAPEQPEGGSWTENISGSHGSGELGGLFYTTRGASRIKRAHVEGHWNDSGSHIQNYMILYTGATPPVEDYDAMPEVTEEGRGWGGYACEPVLGCPETTAGPALPQDHNTAAYDQELYGAGEGHAGVNTVTSAYVDISQEAGPEIEFNKASSTIYNSATKEYVPNVLYGAGGWLGPHSGAFEVRAKDPGLGLSFYRVLTFGWGEEHYYYDDGECVGVQCPEYDYQGYTYKTGMADGETSFEAHAEDPVGLYAHIYPQKIKVDATPPHNIKIAGLQNGNELPMGEAHLKIEAKDGEGTTKSSGIKSIKVAVDGREVSGSAASCSEGPCTASTEFTLVARDYTSGQHTLVVTATDSANNVAQEEFSLRVGGASPVSVGPGSVDPSDGQFKLASTDVSLGGISGVARTYESRELTAGAEGPLGPQWNISLGGGEGLKLLLSGSAVLNANGGSNTTFVRDEEGKFHSPAGDSNLTLESKEKVPGKGITEYLLTDPNTGAETKFEQPTAAQSTIPSFTEQFGMEAGQLKHPRSDAIDSVGNVWVTSSESNLVEKFSSTGLLLATYGSQGTGEKQFISPWGIAIDSRNGNVYVTDQANNRVEELSSTGAFIKAFGWGVGKAAKAEFEICTKECKAGLAGSGNGEFYVLAGLTVDSSGNVWVADYGNNRIEEFNEKGEYLKKFGSVGKGAEQFEGPLNIAIYGSDLYITDYRNNRVQEFSTGGTHVGSFGEGGSENGKFSTPYGIAVDPRSGNLYVVDTGNTRVQEFTSAGAFITKFGTSGTGAGQFTTPIGVAVNSTGNIYVVDYGSNSIDVWMRPLWLPTETGGALAASATTYAYTVVEEEGKPVVQPTEALAPIPAGVSSCAPMVAGCRSLTFEYGKETTAKGENASEWGSYKGHLEKVWFHGYSPAAKKVVEVEVGRYEYDNKGRLRAEWDPRLEHPLKTLYGYDTEGHVTALTPPGEESWVFTYGTIPGDSSGGRLLKVTRAPASASLWNGELAHNTAAPKLTGAAIVGVRMSVSNGSWSNSPVAYSYQWEDCNTSGSECAPILGATNANYTVATSDSGHKLVVQVAAVNGGGTVTATTTSSSEIKGAEISEYALPAGSNPYGITAGPDENLWFTNTTTGKVGKLTTAGVLKEYAAEKDEPEGITTGSDENLWFVEHSVRHVNHMTTSGALTVYTLTRTSTSNVGIVSGPDENLWFTESEAGYIGKINVKDEVLGEYKLPTGSQPYGITVGPDKNLWFTDYATGYIGKITTSGTIIEYKLPTGSQPYGIAAGPDGNLWFTDYGTGYVGKITTSGTITEYKLPTGSKPRGIVAGPEEGSLWFAEYGSSKMGKITTSGAITEYALPSGSEPLSVAVGSDKNIWFTEYGTSKIGKIVPNPTPGEAHTGGPGATIEYGVPTSGTGAPYTLSKEEIEKWGQKDAPVEGAAIFPPDEPQGWPSNGYTSATVHYWDSYGRSVNTVVPSKGISTSEYNTANEVKRTLSADNRAAALKEGCVSVAKKECLSAEASEKLDTRTEYNPEETEIVKILGPEHQIKLSSGAEVQAREVTHDYYDEDAEQAEEKYGEEYNLLTRTTDGALLSGGEEKDVRTTIFSYNGQEDLGWKLRKATSTTVDPAGLDLVHTTVYDKNTGDVIETKAPAGTSETVYPPAFSRGLGSLGSGSGQLNEPESTAIDTKGDIWVTDSNNKRVQEFSPEGSVLTIHESKGTGEEQLINPWGIAINNTTGNVYVTDNAHSRITELDSTGKFVRNIGTEGTGEGQLKDPLGITIDSHGYLWIADSANNRIEEFSETGTYLNKFGLAGSGPGQFNNPIGIAISEGELFVVDSGNDRIEEFAPSGTFLAQFCSEGTGEGQLKEPRGIATNPATGVLYVSDAGNERIQEFSTAGKPLTHFGFYGSGNDAFHQPTGIALNATGELYIADVYNNRISEWALPGSGGAHLTYSGQIGTKGSGSGQFNFPFGVAVDGQGDLWVTDFNNSRIQKFAPSGAFLAAYGSKGTGNGQFIEPSGIAVNQSTGNVYVSDSGNHRVQEFNSEGTFIRAFGTAGSGAGQFAWPEGIKIDSSGNVWVADPNNNRIEKFTATGEYKASYGTAGAGNGQFKEPSELAFAGGHVYVTDYGNDRVQELSMEGVYIAQFGKEGNNSGEFKSPEAIVSDAAGNLYVSDFGNNRIQEFSQSGTYLGEFAYPGNTEGQILRPLGLAINAAGDLYIADSGDYRIEIWAPANQAAHDIQTIYYSVAANATHPNCGEHAEWANLECQTQLATQPVRGLPELPVTTMTYNFWDEIEKTEEAFGTGSKTVTRSKTQTYDPAGRALTSEETATPATDTALPKVTNEYNTTTGLLEKQSTSEGSITSKYNTLGQIVEYADASGNVAKYSYEAGSDGRLLEISEGKSKEAESNQTYAYDPTTGQLTKLVDSAAGTFTASYDLEGHMTSETYPNKMTATYTMNTLGQTTGVIYEKNAHCATSCPETWFSDSVSPGIHGETLQQTSTLAKENYAYDRTGRLLETQETPVGKGCVTRLYAYDEESNRTSLTSREPGTEGKCATEGGTVERHTYDEANRLTDENITYETFGDITRLPAADAGGHELTSTYYVDGQVAVQEQNKQLIGYKYDPAGRTTETTSENTETKAKTTTISHYAGSGGALTWTSEGTEKWTRNIPGIDGTLAAIQESSGTTVLEIHDLQGNIVGKAALGETETKLLSTYNSTEFGVPTTSNPPKYSWLGADGVASELTATGVSTQNGSSYVPEIGRPLQTGPIASPGAFPDGTGGVGIIEAPYLEAAAGQMMSIAIQENAQREEAKRREAEEIAKMNECPASECGPWPEEEGEAYDPPGLASYNTTLRRAKQLEKDAANTALLAYAAAFIPDFGEFVSGGIEGLRAALEASAKSLGGCSTARGIEGRKYKLGVCYIHETRLGYKGFSIPISAEAELCTYERTTKSGVNQYECLASGQKKVEGPWYS